jgi:hypothetical protein
MEPFYLCSYATNEDVENATIEIHYENDWIDEWIFNSCGADVIWMKGRFFCKKKMALAQAFALRVDSALFRGPYTTQEFVLGITGEKVSLYRCDRQFDKWRKTNLKARDSRNAKVSKETAICYNLLRKIVASLKTTNPVLI